MAASGVYTITCIPTGHVYVGVSRDTDARRKQHFGALRRGGHTCKILQTLYREHAEDQFAWKVVEEIPIDRGGYTMSAILGSAERRWREKLASTNTVIGSKAMFNGWVNYPGWTHEDDEFARGIYKPVEPAVWDLLD